MAGIVTSNKTRKLVGNRLKEIDVPTTTLNTALYYADLTAQGASYTASHVNAELNAYPVTVKNNASLALTPSANKAGIVYAMNGDSKTLEEFEFQRGSSGTYFDASGVMQLAAPNVPRINFENGVAKGLLIEPASSNLFTDSGLANGLASIGPKSAFGLTAVDSSFNIGTSLVKGIKFEHNADNIVFGYKTFSFSAGVTYTFSFFIKMDDGSAPSGSDFRITIQTVTLISGFKITSVGNNVYRVSVQHVGISGAAQYAGIGKYSVNTTKSFIVSGYQLEESPIATSYIPTTTAVATRLADKVLSKRPTAVFSKNSINVKTAEWPSTWMDNGVDNIIGRNFFLNSNSPNLFTGRSGVNVVNIGKVTVEEWGTSNANRLTLTGGTDVMKSALSVITPKLGEKVSASGWFKNNHNSNSVIIHSNQGNKSLTINPGQQTRVQFADIEGNGVGAVQFQIRTTDPSHSVDITYWNLKYEKGVLVTPWSPAPEDYVKINGPGAIEISSDEPIHLQQFSLISRELSQEEV